jgi:hypothetical protein
MDHLNKKNIPLTPAVTIPVNEDQRRGLTVVLAKHLLFWASNM